MRVKHLLNGELEVQDEDGVVHRIGPEHPDYRLHLRSVRIDPKKARIGGIVSILVGLGLLWLNWHLLVTSGYYYVALVFFAPAILFFGLLVVVRPDYAGPAPGEADARPRTAVMILFLVLMLAASGLNWYLLANYHP